MALSKEYTLSSTDDDSLTSLLSSQDSSEPDARCKSSRRGKPWLILLGFSIMLLLSNASTFYLTHLHAIHTYRSIAEPPSGTPSIFRNLHLPPHPRLINTTVYDPDHNIYRQHASIEADEAWENLSPSVGGAFFIKKEDAVRDGIDPGIHAHFDVPELGIDGYPVLVETMHQMHCLNMLRKSLYFNHDFYLAQARTKCPEENTPQCGVPASLFELHIDHCLDYLRSRLMCTTDVGLVPLMWLGREGRVTGDMARMHTCRDYEAARDFIVRESTDLPKTGSVKPKPHDHVIWDYI